MSTSMLPIGCLVRIDKPALQEVIAQLNVRGYRVIGPRVAESAIVFADLDSVQQLPIGYRDEQEGGRYRLLRTGDNSYFAYVVGPHSLKNFLFPSHTTLFEATRVNGSWQVKTPPLPQQPLAVIGARACDLQALAVLDRVFLEGPYINPDYQARREQLFVVAVNCGRAAATCFCASMNSGPAVQGGADLALYELPTHFVLEIGTERGGEVLAAVPWRPCTGREVMEAQQVPREAAAQIRRRLDPANIRRVLLDNLEHERWDQVAQRCLGCANCTMVCPTCFCSRVEEVGDLSGNQARRELLWDSCFNSEHSYMNSGTIRKSIKSRYRQWLTHKLASWHDQFGTSGCTGCGRCITWCPVGIDLTEEVAAIRGGT